MSKDNKNMINKKLNTMGDLVNGVYYDAATDELIEIWNVDQQGEIVAFSFATANMPEFAIAPVKDKFHADVFYIGEV